MRLLLGEGDFYEWFLGPRMIYTSGVCTDYTVEQSLETLQDKPAIICEKLDLKPTGRFVTGSISLLSLLGCGWGSLITYATKNYDCNATGCTLSVNQAAFGTERIKKNGVSADKARNLCSDYSDLPVGKGAYTKIISLEMSHVGIHRYSQFLRPAHDLLDDHGIFVIQVAGIRPPWQHPLQLEGAGFEIKNVDVLGVHYSATIYLYGERWYRVFFLAY
ncbi:Cyclopropane-fatty-acyl-phospholipid synthase [Termitomyces sp. J132]|nr:Cyclopropane-fatty-acyl-phospholipid synthase [Termitomyces sp. J132]